MIPAGVEDKGTHAGSTFSKTPVREISISLGKLGLTKIRTWLSFPLLKQMEEGHSCDPVPSVLSHNFFAIVAQSLWSHPILGFFFSPH